jgi:Sec-independent protein translocase protein TatA
MGRSLGRGMREFKDSISGDNKDRDEERPAPELTAAAPPAEEHPVAVAQQRAEERDPAS